MNATVPRPPRSIHGLPVLTPVAASIAGYKSITVDISASTEARILAGVCQWRNPQRCCLARQSADIYQLCILREDVRGSDTEND